MATRFYFPTSGAQDVTVAIDALWHQSSQAIKFKAVTSKISSSFSTISDTETSATIPYEFLLGQWVSGQFEAFEFLSGGSQTVKCVVRFMESDGKGNLLGWQSLRVVSADGATVRGALTDGQISGEADYKALENRFLSGNIDTSVSMQDGDRLVFEIGCYASNSSTDPFTMSAEFGDNSGTDLAENDTSQSQFCPWYEISPTLVPYTPPVTFIPRIMSIT